MTNCFYYTDKRHLLEKMPNFEEQSLLKMLIKKNQQQTKNLTLT